MDYAMDSFLQIELPMTLRSIFGDNLVFSFVFGGFAKGYGDESHDIDIMICVEKVDEVARRAYLNYYLETHRRLGLKPDLDDPCEFGTRSDYSELMRHAESVEMRPVIDDYRSYEAVVRTDALSGRKSGIYARDEFLSRLSHDALSLVQEWRDQIKRFPNFKKVDQDRSITEMCMAYVHYNKVK